MTRKRNTEVAAAFIYGPRADRPQATKPLSPSPSSPAAHRREIPEISQPTPPSSGANELGESSSASSSHKHHESQALAAPEIREPEISFVLSPSENHHDDLPVEEGASATAPAANSGHLPVFYTLSLLKIF